MTPRRMMDIDWDASLEERWWQMTMTVGVGPSKRVARLDLDVWNARRPNGPRKTSLWAEPYEPRVYTPHQGLLALVNVIQEAERDYWLNYRRRKGY